MASDYVPTSFLLFPNEIIRSVFDYLSSTDLLQSFGYISNTRIQDLLAVQISTMKLDVSDASSLEWVNEHLPVVQQYVKHISVDIELFGELLTLIPVLDALTICYDEDTQYLVDYFLTEFQKFKNVCIGAITLMTYDGVISSKTAEILLGENGQLPEHTLIIDSCLLQIDIEHLPLSQLRHLNCLVTEEKVLHALCAHLPKLETIEIGFISNGLQIDRGLPEDLKVLGISSERLDESDATPHILHITYKAEVETDKISVVAPAHLRSVVIKGPIPTFSRLSRLFVLASASLKTIKIKLRAYFIIDPEEINIIDRHIDFQFNIDYNSMYVPNDFDWQQYVDKFTQHPALRYDNTAFCNLSSVINRTAFWLRTRKMLVTSPRSLCFSRAEILKFEYCQITMNNGAVQFIQRSFPQVHMLVWRLSQPKVSTKMTLDTIKTLFVHSEDPKALASLLTLCPKVNQVCFTLAFEGTDDLPELKDACKQITLVKLVPKDKVTAEQMQKLFPNATITYDATPYYERRF